MGIFAIALARSGHSFAWAAMNLTLVGFFGGLFAVPLNALLQQRSGGQEKGRLMATNNFLNMVAIMIASGVLSLCSDQLGLPPDRILIVFGCRHVAVQHLRALASCRSSWCDSVSGC